MAKPTKLFIGNLHYDVRQQDLETTFLNAGVGPARSIKIPFAEDGRNKGFAFVDFESNQAATAAVNVLDGYMLMGRPLRPDWAREPEPTRTRQPPPRESREPPRTHDKRDNRRSRRRERDRDWG